MIEFPTNASQRAAREFFTAHDPKDFLPVPQLGGAPEEGLQAARVVVGSESLHWPILLLDRI